MNKNEIIMNLDAALTLLTAVYNEIYDNDLEYDVAIAMDSIEVALEQARAIEE
jgi:hypothetical protein